MAKITYIPGEIANAAIDEHGNRKPVTRTHHIFDDTKNKNQAEVNAEVDDTFAFHQSEINALNSQNYVTVDSFSSLPATGAVDTVYRVSNWDGTQQDPTVYSEYAWNGEDYVHLSTKTQIGEVFDISAYHATGGELAKYADLAAALGTNGANIPQSLQKGGMSVKFVQTPDNKYIQARCMAQNFTTDVTQWQGVDSEPTAGSDNLVKSGGVHSSLLDTRRELQEELNLAVESITPIEITGDVTNAPDEEDLTSVNVGGTDVLKFKDKAYNSLTYSGMGRKILRKNIVEGVNTLTQEMMSDANTIYVIQYDYDLNGEDITIPVGCILEFDGGSLSNGNVVLQNTLIEDNVNFDNIVFSGTCKNDVLTPDMFGAVGNDIHDDTKAFKSLAAVVTAMDGGKIFIPAKTYLITESIYFKGNIEFSGVGNKSVLHLGNSNSGIHFGEVDDYVLVDAYLTDGEGTITGKDINNNYVTCKCTLKGDRTIKVSDASKFTPNEYYVIQDTCDFSFENTRAYYRQGEIIRIKSVDIENNTITLYNGLYGVYGNDQNFEGYVERTDRDLFEQRFITCLSGINHRTIFCKYNYKQVNLHNFNIYSEGDNTSTVSGYYSLSVYNVIRSKIDSIEITSEGGSYVSFKLGGAYKSSILNSKFHTDFTPGVDLYGASFGDIQDVLVSNCTFGGRAHSLATGNKPDVGAIVNRNFIYERLSSDSINNVEDTINIDVHAGAELYTYRDIDLPSGQCDTGGYYVTIENCRFRVISLSFFSSGLKIKNVECKAIGSLLSFVNPWHDYSNDEMIIEDCKIKGGYNFGPYSGADCSITFTAQGSNSSYPINNLIIRNSIIENGVYVRYKLANTIIIENNIISLKSDRTGISIYQRRNYNNNNYIIIRNNKIIQNFNAESILIGYNSNTGVDEIAGNLIIENNYIQNNVYTRASILICDIYNGVIKGNQIIAKSRIIDMVDSNCGFYNNIMISNDDSLSYYIQAFTDKYTYNIDFDDSNIIKVKKVNLKNYQTNKYRVHYHNSSVRDNINLFVNDNGYEFFDTDLKKTVKVNFTDKSTIKNGTFPAGDADSGIFVPNDLVDGAIYNVGMTNRSDFYLAKTNVNPTADDLKLIFKSSNWGWDFRLFKNDASEYPYLYFVNTGGSVESTSYYSIKEQDVWKEEDGASAGVKRSGATTDRPTGYYIYVGFKYMDTTLGKPIYASVISGDTVTWVDATGTPV